MPPCRVPEDRRHAASMRAAGRLGAVRTAWPWPPAQRVLPVPRRPEPRVVRGPEPLARQQPVRQQPVRKQPVRKQPAPPERVPPGVRQGRSARMPAWRALRGP
jgi:hypothetical protein